MVIYHYFPGQFFLGEIFFSPLLTYSIGQGSIPQDTNFAAPPASVCSYGH